METIYIMTPKGKKKVKSYGRYQCTYQVKTSPAGMEENPNYTVSFHLVHINRSWNYTEEQSGLNAGNYYKTKKEALENLPEVFDRVRQHIEWLLKNNTFAKAHEMLEKAKEITDDIY